MTESLDHLQQARVVRAPFPYAPTPAERKTRANSAAKSAGFLQKLPAAAACGLGF